MVADTYHGDGLGLYAYYANNPVVYYNPRGHDSAAVTKKAEDGNHEYYPSQMH